MAYSNRFFCLALLAGATFFGGCSSGSGSAGSTGSNATCDDMCTEGLKLPCTTNTQEQCVSSCEAEISDKGECSGSFIQVEICMFQKLGCDLPNSTTGQLIDACPGEFAAYSSCSACQVDANDDACDSCSKSKCCAERKAAYSDAGVMQASACFVDCTLDSALCEQMCFDQYPSARTKIEALASCTANACAGC